MFWEAWELLEADFYGEFPDLSEASRAAVKGVTRSLGDPNTFLLEPDLAKVVSEDMTGQFEGIGASVLYLWLSTASPGMAELNLTWMSWVIIFVVLLWVGLTWYLNRLGCADINPVEPLIRLPDS